MEPKEIIIPEEVKKDEKQRNLLEYFRDAVEGFKKRETLGSVKLEHTVFIPAVSLNESVEDTNNFIVLARTIRKNEGYYCPVSYEQISAGKQPGLLFVFEFTKYTNFDGILSLIDSKLSTAN